MGYQWKKGQEGGGSVEELSVEGVSGDGGTQGGDSMGWDIGGGGCQVSGWECQGREYQGCQSLTPTNKRLVIIPGTQFFHHQNHHISRLVISTRVFTLSSPFF